MEGGEDGEAGWARPHPLKHASQHLSRHPPPQLQTLPLSSSRLRPLIGRVLQCPLRGGGLK